MHAKGTNPCALKNESECLACVDNIVVVIADVKKVTTTNALRINCFCAI